MENIIEITLEYFHLVECSHLMIDHHHHEGGGQAQHDEQLDCRPTSTACL